MQEMINSYIFQFLIQGTLLLRIRVIMIVTKSYPLVLLPNSGFMEVTNGCRCISGA